MNNMECLKCGYEFEGFIGDECPNCNADNEQVIDKKEKLEIKREEKIRAFKEKMKTKCINNVKDGAGNYCKKVKDTSGWHTYYRTECYGRKGNCKFPEFYEERN